jgi:exodeoxyribonuclease VII large subunit
MPGGFFDFMEQRKQAKARAASAAPGAPSASAALRSPSASAAPSSSSTSSLSSTRSEPLSVAAVTSLIDRALRGGLPERLLVRGEISNFSPHRGSGHLYFTLKDAQAAIDCVMFASSARSVKFTPADGMEVIASGQVRVYPQRGRYQLYVGSLQPVGQGALELAFRQLVAKLKSEGLFDAARKKPIPDYPRRIALVTARGGAALQDMLKVLRRFPHLELLLASVPVQGEQAAPRIAETLALLNRHAMRLGGIDVILLARGGGSLEDLWAFNEEIVARAIAESRIPVISGVGHETDTTIADFVADHRAHTPTEAATFVTQHWKDAIARLPLMQTRLRQALRQVVRDARQRLAPVAAHEFFRRPLHRVRQLQQLLDDRERSLTLALSRVARRASVDLHRLSARLSSMHPQHRLRLAVSDLSHRATRLGQATETLQRRRVERVNALAQQLELLSPNAVLRRGYSITIRKDSGRVLRSATELRGGERLLTRLAEGEVESVADDPSQPRLFD